MDRKKHEEEHENEERWLLTYADLITLLMAFFVVMYALSRVDVAKFDQLSASLNVAFGTPKSSVVILPGMIQPQEEKSKGTEGRKVADPPGLKVPKAIVMEGENLPPLVETSESAETAEALESLAMAAELAGQDGLTGAPGEGEDIRGQGSALFALMDQLERSIRDQGLDSLISVGANTAGTKLVLRFSDSLFFQPGSAELTSEARDLIAQLGGVILQTGMPVGVEGHTDSIPISNALYRSNWHLSTARAMSVLLFLADELGFPPTLLSASGYGEYRPIGDNETPEGRSKNRRVEFVISERSEPPIDL